MYKKIIIILITICYIFCRKAVFASEDKNLNLHNQQTKKICYQNTHYSRVKKLNYKDSKIQENETNHILKKINYKDSIIQKNETNHILRKINYKDSKFQENENEEKLLDETNEKYGIKSFLNESKKYATNLEIDDIYKSTLIGNLNNKKILSRFFNLFSKTFKTTLKNFSSIIVIILVCTILKSVADNLGNESVSKIAYFAEFALIVTILLKNFSDVIFEMKESLQNLLSFSNILIPLLSTLMIASGNITSANLLEPLLIFLATFACNFIKNAVIPIMLISTSIGIVSNISDEIQLGKLSNLLRKGSIWVLTTVLSIIISLASLESNLTANVSSITKKASKTIISSAVPVVGNILSNAIETITGYGNIIKNATGVIGIIIVAAICISPICKIGVYTVLFAIIEGLIEPITDKKIVNIFEVMKQSFKVFLGSMFATAVMCIIGLAIVIKITE